MEGVCRILNVASQLFASSLIWTVCVGTAVESHCVM